MGISQKLSTSASSRSSAGVGGNATPTYQSILGPNLNTLWHSQLGIAPLTGPVDTWTDQIGNRVAQAPAAANRPVYAADGSLFRGKRVVQCLQDPGTGPLWMQTAQLAGAFPLTGQRPWIFACLHWRDLTAATHSAFSLADLADTSPVWFNGTATQTSWRNPTSGTTVTTGATPGTTLQYTMNGWCDGTNSSLVLNGGAATTAATANALAGDIVRVRFAATGSGANSGSVSIAVFGICFAQPPATQVTALNALIASEFG